MLLRCCSNFLKTFSQKILGGFSYAIPAIVGIVVMGSLNSSLFSSSRSADIICCITLNAIRFIYFPGTFMLQHEKDTCQVS